MVPVSGEFHKDDLVQSKHPAESNKLKLITEEEEDEATSLHIHTKEYKMDWTMIRQKQTNKQKGVNYPFPS